MNKTKKLLCIVLAVCMAAMLGVNAYATMTDVETSNNPGIMDLTHLDVKAAATYTAKLDGQEIPLEARVDPDSIVVTVAGPEGNIHYSFANYAVLTLNEAGMDEYRISLDATDGALLNLIHWDGISFRMDNVYVKATLVFDAEEVEAYAPIADELRKADGTYATTWEGKYTGIQECTGHNGLRSRGNHGLILGLDLYLEVPGVSVTTPVESVPATPVEPGCPDWDWGDLCPDWPNCTCPTCPSWPWDWDFDWDHVCPDWPDCNCPTCPTWPSDWPECPDSPEDPECPSWPWWPWWPWNPTEPTETEPVVTDPSVPDVTDPSVPDVTDPSETDPSVPDVTDPSETDPSVPDVTDPSETDPSVPDETDPSVPDETDPSETDPSVPGESDPTNSTVDTNGSESTTAPTTAPADPDDVPYTGDNTVAVLVALMTISAIGLVVTLVSGKRGYNGR